MRSVGKWIVGIFVLMAFQCNDELDFALDHLYPTGIFTTWEWDAETVNGISDLSSKCCRFYEFYPDDKQDDLKGHFSYWEDTSMYYNGLFILDTLHGEILFEREGKPTVTYQYSVSTAKDYLIFTFSADSSTYEQGFMKLY